MPAPECGKRRKDCFQLEGILYFSPEERPEIVLLALSYFKLTLLGNDSDV